MKPSFSPAAEGSFEHTHVPDTLDLADRARLAINALTGTLDVDHEYEVFQLCGVGGEYSYFVHENTGLPTINPKYAEALPMMRVMSGGTQNVDHQNAMMEMILSRIQPPGLFFVPPATPTYRPWTQAKFGGSTEWHANVYGNGRLLLGCMAWLQYTGDPGWEDVCNTLAEGLIATAVYREDYAYYPDASKGGEPFSYAKSGWRTLDEPNLDDDVSGESLFMYTGGQARALARWAAMSGNEKALDLSQRICRFMMKERFWGIEGSWNRRGDIPYEKELATVSGPDRGMWRGHTAGRLEALRGLIECGIVSNDLRMKEFVRSAYEWMRHYGFARVGYFPVILGMVAGGECGLSRATALAIKLTESGIGDYWEDVDQFVRNGLVSAQRLPSDFTEEQFTRSAEGPPMPQDITPLGPGIDVDGAYDTRNVLQRYVGAFGHGCCTANQSTGLYYAWESGLRMTGSTATVNLLLNRTSPWMNVESHLPYDGKVVLRNKTAERVSVRIPAWARMDDVRTHLNGKDVSPFRIGRFLILDGLRPRDEITLTFPMVTETTTYTVMGEQHRCTFKGNTLVGIEPRSAFFGIRPPPHDVSTTTVTPTKETDNFVTASVLQW